jgi:ABC-2 type transport system permease protein
MNKISIIARSEYLRRVKSKGFIIATILAPVGLLVLIGVSVWVGVLTQETGARTVAIVDRTERLGAALADRLPDSYTAAIETVPEDSLQARVRRGELDGYFVLPQGLLGGGEEAAYYSEGGGGFSAQFRLQDAVGDVVRRARLEAAGASAEVLDAAEERVGVRLVALTDEGESEDATWLFAGLGYAMGFIIYIAMFVYGAMVMRGVIEEKTNRIVEVVASSARPFQLMMGKVLGIGAVGLTQFALWVALALAGLVALGTVLAGFVDPAALAGGDAAATAAAVEDLPFDPAALTLANVPFDLIVYFLLFFLGGYLLYGSLFAAVGSAVEQESDAQSLQLPVMIPVILPAVFLPFVADNPDAPVSIALSLVPFFSPILMVVRAAATAVPFWQMALALVLLALAFVGTIWVASRIYRVGILMYGKKATFRDLARWVRYA